MTFYEQLARILAAVILIAAFAVPSMAWAHEGHHVPSVAKAVTAPSETQATIKKAILSIVNGAALTTARASVPIALDVFTDCSGHCCGGAAGMACCGAALAPDACSFPFFKASLPLLIRDVPLLGGIPPEALPKPPKSFA